MPLVINQTYSNEDVRNEFKCSLQSGMNKSNTTNTLVLTRKHINNIYNDKQVDDVIYYTGKGRIGDQYITRENKTLRDAKLTNTRVVLFEIFEETQYIYRGDVELIDEPFIESQPDAEGSLRRVYIFPLKLVDARLNLLSHDVYKRTREKNSKQTKKLSDQELNKKLLFAENKKPGYSYTSVKTYQRSSLVIEKVLRRAKGFCELCKEAAPFKKKNGEPYLEVHHIQQLAKSGPDTVKNVVALCPNCHRKMHSLALSSDEEKLKKITNA